ncbi:nitroreductase family protein [Marinobacterium jannaschii]|uniref:nitroreductase family protein n=1 Tax=Marinobacterium jannaschii TaxID=64970 RepID=UPI0004879549|nr:nitroreductase [Marinobacterium jannaschii]
MDAIEALLSRRSYPRRNLIQPAPERAQLEQILQTAMTVPDHGNLKPWRFVVVQGEGIKDLSQLVRLRYADKGMTEQQLEAFVDEIAATPMMIYVCSALKTEHRIPVLEQQLAGAAACEHILLAAHALGFGGIWHSLEADKGLREMLQMSEEDLILGVLSLGTPKRTAPAKRKSFADFTLEWDRQGGLRPWQEKSE